MPIGQDERLYDAPSRITAVPTINVTFRGLGSRSKSRSNFHRDLHLVRGNIELLSKGEENMRVARRFRGAKELHIL